MSPFDPKRTSPAYGNVVNFVQTLRATHSYSVFANPLASRVTQGREIRAAAPGAVPMRRLFSWQQSCGKDWGSAMAKKVRKKAASKATKKSRALPKKKGAVTKKKRKAAAKKKSKPIAKKKLTRKKIRKPPPESLRDEVAGAFTAVVDTLTDAERLHHKLDPGVSREPE
jgi:hypothetical protein